MCVSFKVISQVDNNMKSKVPNTRNCFSLNLKLNHNFNQILQFQLWTTTKSIFYENIFFSTSATITTIKTIVMPNRFLKTTTTKLINRYYDHSLVLLTRWKQIWNYHGPNQGWPSSQLLKEKVSEFGLEVVIKCLLFGLEVAIKCLS